MSSLGSEARGALARIHRGTTLVWYGARFVLPGGPDLSETARRLLRAWGARVEATGPATGLRGDRPALIVANHISALDILAISSQVKCRFLTYPELFTQPGLGPFLRRAGTLAAPRAHVRDLATAVRTLTAALRESPPVVVFPEATSSDSARPRRFHSALFEAARAAGAPVHPLSLDYGELRASLAFGDITLGEHARRLLAEPRPIVVRARWSSPLDPAGFRDRRALASAAYEAICAELSGSA